MGLKLPCVDVKGWQNFWGSTCADYAEHWCTAGRVTNLSVAGSLFGSPEHACCSCGRGALPPSEVTELYLFAMHTVPRVDARILWHHANDLRGQGSAEAWVMLYWDRSIGLPAPALVARWRSLGVPTCVWRERDVFSLLPAVLTGLRASKALNRSRTSP